jgi:hypothetical protein
MPFERQRPLASGVLDVENAAMAWHSRWRGRVKNERPKGQGTTQLRCTSSITRLVALLSRAERQSLLISRACP